MEKSKKQTMSVKRRTLWGVLVTLTGALLFLPFVHAQGQLTVMSGIVFVSITSIIAGLASFFGWRLADIQRIPSPLLRSLDSGDRASRVSLYRTALVSIAIGAAVGLAMYTALKLFGISTTNPGDIWVRLATTVWASVFLEIVGHLFVQTAVLRIVKLPGIAIVAAGLVLAFGFHSGGATGGIEQQLILSGLNFIGLAITGALYQYKGLEAAIIAHATMHIITLGLN